MLIHDRLQAWRQQEAQDSVDRFRATTPEEYVLENREVEQLLADCFLAPIGNQGSALLEITSTRFPPAGPVEIVIATDKSHTKPPSSDETVSATPNVGAEVTEAAGREADGDLTESGERTTALTELTLGTTTG